MAVSLPAVLAALVVAGPAAGERYPADGFRFLLNDERVCDAAERLCLRGTLSWEPNVRLFELRGRLLATAEPGELVVTLVGHARDGSRRYTDLSVRLEGRYSEIVDERMIPDWPEVYDWTLEGVAFYPELPAQR